MILVDLKQDRSKENTYFSNTLLNSIEKSLNNKNKVILYLNKRGDYSSLICKKCSLLYKCKNCDVSLNIHGEYLVCHMCNYIKKLPNNCENCASNELQKIGIGTGQIEKFLKEKWKNKSIFRLDTDVIKNKKEKEEALKEINKADIIIGTKMITTGFDFENIGLIGIILLEQELQIPKYNTIEKIYSNLKQFIGRGGRKGEDTDFIIQSLIPENKTINNLVYQNYKDYFKVALDERKKFNYPPFSDFIILEYRDLDKDKAIKYISNLKTKLDQKNTDGKIDIINYPTPFKKQKQYYTKIILKGTNLRAFLSNFKKDIFSNSNLSIIFD